MSSHPISGLLRKEGASSGGTGHHSGGGGGGGGGHCDVGNGDSSEVRGDRGENNHGASSSNVGVRALDVRLIRVDPLLTPTSLSAPNPTTTNNHGPTPTFNTHSIASASSKHAAASSFTMNGDTGMVLGLNCTALIALQHICQ